MDDNEEIQIWKTKRLLKSLESARGGGTSMISLVIPAGDNIALSRQMLNIEYGTASNIKSRVNRLSVLSAITSTLQKLKLYKSTPTNGLAVFCGEIITEDGKQKKLNIDFEPHRPIKQKLYLCDNRFHTESLRYLLESNNKYGFIIMDGNGALFATLTGQNTKIVSQFGVSLPKKHGRGGQSALRFARLRMEARRNYMRKVCETAVKSFIHKDVSIVKGLIIGGSADLKTELTKSNLFDGRLKKMIMQIVDISYGGTNGLQQAIQLASETLSNVRLVQEKKILSDYYSNIAQDTGMYSFGINDTFKALELGAVDKLIVWDDIPQFRYVVRNPATLEEDTIYLKSEEESNPIHFQTECGLAKEIVSKDSLLDWLVENYKQYGTKLEIVTDRSSEGAQFCMGFGGFGALLRWKVDFDVFVVDDDDDFI